ncbi:uncharacterized protein BROUX77_002546 [Berkeleyomyces rouxiae]|uniref:uncharacterized protein n=1 Tax=Berkeleyomyces rouxiae TaxID=2035830 RepID=UPI003B7C04C8
MLDRCRRQAAVRIASLDEFHPLARLARARTSTRLTLRHRKLPRAPPTTRILPLAYSPPKPPEPKDAQRIRAAKSRIARIPYCDLRVFSDGSKLQDGSTGAAAALYITGLELPTVSIHLGKMMEVYDAELIEALTGLKAALQSPAATFAENVIVMLDNQEAAYRLLIGQPTLTSQGIILDFRATADRRPLRTRNSISPGPGKVMVQWIPGHTDIPGNEAADRAAKAAVSTPPPEHHESVSSLAALASWARSQHLKNVTAYWHGNIPGTYLELQIPWYVKAPPELHLPRFYLSYLLQCRTAHGDFTCYHQKLGHPPEGKTCACGSAKSLTHFLPCRPAWRQAEIAEPKLRLGSIQVLLGTPKGAILFARFLGASNFLTRVLPGRLAGRLRDYGFPSWACRWARSFASDRSAHLRIESFIAPTASLAHGLPQGSPASPILFLLFIAPMHHSNMHFGYADDAAMLGHASSLQDSAANATKLANEAIKWGAENGLSFSSGKTELQHFHRTRETEPSVTIGPATIPE